MSTMSEDKTDYQLKSIFISALVVLTWATRGQATIITAASCSFSHVQAALQDVQDGDTIEIPAGTCTWSQSLVVDIQSVPRSLTLKGAGMDQTILIDDIPENNTRGPLFEVKTTDGKAFRLTGFTFRTSANHTRNKFSGLIELKGKSKTFRIDHNRFDITTFSGPAIVTYEWLYGVIDHNIFDNATQAVRIWHDKWGDAGLGDGSFASPLSLGSEKAVYIENNHFKNRVVTDGYAGARFVVRHNLIEATGGPIGNHGTDSSGRYRGTFSWEVYGNTATVAGTHTFIHMRSGTGVIFDNKVTGSPFVTHLGTLNNYRNSDAYPPWGACDGSSPYDKNEGIIYESGAHTGGSVTTGVLTHSGKNWTFNQWVGHSLRNITKNWGSEITGNTANTISIKSSINNASREWDPGDAYQILRVDACLDQIGRIGGQFSPVHSNPLPQAWPNQILEPVYTWGNTLNGTANNTVGSPNYVIKPNRDFIIGTPRPNYTPFTYPHPLTTSGFTADAIVAASCSQADVQAALNQAPDGSTVSVPPGTCTWTTPVVGPSDKGIKLIGAGIGNTIIRRGTNLTHEALLMHAPAEKFTEVAGFTFDSQFDGKPTHPHARFLTIESGSVQGVNTYRVHHNAFTNIRGRGLYLSANGIISSGLTDHNQFYCGQDGTTTCQGIAGDNCSSNGLDPSTAIMSRPLEYGSPYANYAEDNEYFATRTQDGTFDNYSCGRQVQRFEKIHGMNMGSHGTESRRGTQQWEYYNNHIDTDYFDSGEEWGGRWVHLRNGTGYFFNNTATQSMTGNIGIYMYRMDPTFQADMILNYCTPLHPTDPGPHPRDGRLGGTTGYETRPVGWPCLDQIGWKFDYLGGDGGTFFRYPAYVFGNRRANQSMHAGFGNNPSNIPYIRENFEFFNENPDFDGSFGVGVGTKAQMMSLTPTLPYVGFWVTDEGEWNSTNGSVPDGCFYQWTGSSWTLRYTPYSYPHPLITGAPSSAPRPPAPPVIDASRVTNWKQAGVPGGIPKRTTICATIDAAIYGNGTVDASAAINAAIQNCAANQVVYLPAGEYLLQSSIHFQRSHVSLRGAGKGKTILKPITGAKITTRSLNQSAERVIVSGSTKGSKSITVNDASGIVVGSMLDIYHDDDPDFYWSRSGPGDHWGGSYRNGQQVMVTAVSGTTLTLEDELVWNFTRNPRFRFLGTNLIRGIGLEDFTMTAGDAYTSNFIEFSKTYASWIKGIETAWGKGNSHIQLYNCARTEIRDSYIHDTHSTADGYGINSIASSALQYGRGGCTGTLIENNVISGLRRAVMFESETGSVVAYNYSFNIRFTGWPSYQQPDFNANHSPHGMMTLWEGNVAVGWENDGYHGSTSHQTLFRNSFHGKHSEPHRTGNIKLIDLTRFSYYHNVVGNILGSSDFPRNTIGQYEMTGRPGYTSQAVIYRLGYPNTGNNAYHDTNPPSDPNSGGLDPKVKATLLRHGNYDYENLSTLWDPGIENHFLPVSLFRDVKPAWFGSMLWPPIGPDVAGLTTKIPAQYCFEKGLMPSCLLEGGNSVVEGPLSLTLQLPAFLPVNAQISVNYKGTTAPSYFSWSFNPVSSAAPSSSWKQSMTLSPFHAPAATFTTSNAQANLARVPLGLGPYVVTVIAYGSDGQASAPAHASVTLVSADLAGVRVYPNPWRSDRHATRSITFDMLTVNTTIKIFTVSGNHVKTLPSSSTSTTWDLTNESGDRVASGIYIYLMTTESGEKETGKVVIIK
jgi:hypothetical protein